MSWEHMHIVDVVMSESKDRLHHKTSKALCKVTNDHGLHIGYITIEYTEVHSYVKMQPGEFGRLIKRMIRFLRD